MKSGYLKLAQSGELEQRLADAMALLKDCRLCPRQCGVDRSAGERGFCGIGVSAEIASYGPHFGEEAVLVGEKGSGTIFFCGCNLHCVFCQNFDISQPEKDDCVLLEAERLARLMLELQAQGCRNINLVTPSHVVPQILAALPLAVEDGLTIPLVYNSGGYDSVQTLELLDGVVDIYMPDVKFLSAESAGKYLQAPDYPDVVRAALKEMQRQVGDLQIAENGLAERGLLVRHLLMPSFFEDAQLIFTFLAEEISPACYLNIMDQYRPCGRACEFEELQGTINGQYCEKAILAAEKAGLSRIDKRSVNRLIKLLFKR